MSIIHTQPLCGFCLHNLIELSLHLRAKRSMLSLLSKSSNSWMVSAWCPRVVLWFKRCLLMCIDCDFKSLFLFLLFHHTLYVFIMFDLTVNSMTHWPQLGPVDSFDTLAVKFRSQTILHCNSISKTRQTHIINGCVLISGRL